MGAPSNAASPATNTTATPAPTTTAAPAPAKPVPKAAPAGSTAIRPAPRPGTPAGRPPTKGPAKPGTRAPAGRKGWGRTAWALLITGVILLAVGAALEGTFYSNIVDAKTANDFIQSSHAQLAPSKSIPIVELSGSNIAAGNTIVIKDVVSGVLYNASTQTTTLSFQSISNLPSGQSSQKAQEASLANDLFATVSGHPSWISSGMTIVMTFTIVSASIPNFPYSGHTFTYLTLDAAADATTFALNH